MSDQMKRMESESARATRLSFANLALLVASFLCGLILIELALRLLGWSFPVFARPDAELGWSFRPNVSGWSTHENTAYVRINRLGFRGADWSEQPPPNGLRIAVLGDSFVDATNLAEEQSFTGMIETHLAACPAFRNDRVELLNFGVSGYGTAQQYLLLQQKIASFHPNVVLLAFYIGNDVADNSRPLSILQAKPYFIELPSGELQHAVNFRETDTFRQAVRTDWLKRLINKSYFLQALKQAYLGKPILPSPIKSHVFKSTGATAASPQYAEMFAPPPNDIWRAAWSVTEKLLLRMRDWAQERRVDFRMVIIPAPIQALPGDEMRRAVVQKFALADLDYPVDRIAGFAARNGIVNFSLLGPLRAYADRERVFTYGFDTNKPGEGHLNAIGNDVSGRSIASWLCSSANAGMKLN